MSFINRVHLHVFIYSAWVIVFILDLIWVRIPSFFLFWMQRVRSRRRYISRHPEGKHLRHSSYPSRYQPENTRHSIGNQIQCNRQQYEVRRMSRIKTGTVTLLRGRPLMIWGGRRKNRSKMNLFFPRQCLLKLIFSRRRPLKISSFLEKAFWNFFFPRRPFEIYYLKVKTAKEYIWLCASCWTDSCNDNSSKIKVYIRFKSSNFLSYVWLGTYRCEGPYLFNLGLGFKGYVRYRCTCSKENY